MVDVEDLLPMIERIAKTVARDYPDINWIDVNQAVCVFVLENAKSIKSREEGGNPGWILRRVAQQYCKDERTQQQLLTSQYSYRPSDVSKILETAFSVETMDRTHVPEDAESMRSGTDAVELASDIRAAFDRLQHEHKVSIFKRYALNEVPDNASYERKRLNRAVNELTRILNTYRGRATQNRRTVVSNARAHAIISGDF